MVIRPRIRGFICITAHPTGCAAHVREQIDHVTRQPRIQPGPRVALIIGSSTGYGLASRITAAFGCGAATVGVAYERPPESDRPASAGWYNTAAFDAAATRAELWTRSLNGDAFSDALKRQTIEALRDAPGPVDLVVYSLAAPRRTHPSTGILHKSVLKPIGAVYRGRTVDTEKGTVHEVTIEPASEAEIADTVQVMGGEDWELWMEALESAGVLAPGATSVAYSYVGPALTHGIYRSGTIGRAKEHLEATARRIDARLKVHYGRAFISVNKALVTQSSSAIPVVPLYISALYKVMKTRGLHEGCIEQMYRLFATQMYGGNPLTFDDERRVRIDDREMRSDVQAEVEEIVRTVTTETLRERTDFDGYQQEFLRLFGFGMPGIDYGADVPLA